MCFRRKLENRDKHDGAGRHMVLVMDLEVVTVECEMDRFVCDKWTGFKVYWLFDRGQC